MSAQFAKGDFRFQPLTGPLAAADLLGFTARGGLIQRLASAKVGSVEILINGIPASETLTPTSTGPTVYTLFSGVTVGANDPNYVATTVETITVTGVSVGSKLTDTSTSATGDETGGAVTIVETLAQTGTVTVDTEIQASLNSLELSFTQGSTIPSTVEITITLDAHNTVNSFNGLPNETSSDNGAVATGTVDSALTACFYPGTMIRTPGGDVAVENLRIGDAIRTADGQVMPIRWIGRNTVSTRFADPLHVLPIRIRAGALAETLPERDLLLSPEHALLVDGILIQAGALVNGVSILRETAVPEVFTYYHVELADHALILAEGAPAETFVDNIQRLVFDNWAEHEALYGDAPIAEMAVPRAQSHRQVPTEIRARLMDRALAGWAAKQNAA